MSKAELTDEEVAKLVQGGDKESFGELMKRYDAKLSRYGRKFLSSKENIGDMVQDIFINTYRNIQSFDTSLSFSSWIYRIAHNAFVNGLKKQKRSMIPIFDFDVFAPYSVYEDPEQTEREKNEVKEWIEKGLEKLETKYKEVIILHYIEDMSYKEISDIMQVPVGTVGIRIKRGKEKLKEIYGNEEFYGK